VAAVELRMKQSVQWRGNGVYFERPGMARDGYEDRVPATRGAIEAKRLAALRDLELRRFRCDELPVRR
jgi:hypothetical protein